ARMRVEVALTDRAGEVLAETSHPLRKLARQTGEVWLDRDMTWRVDGEPFFLNGAWNHEDGFVPGYNAFSGAQPGDVKLLDTAIMNEVYYHVESLRSDALSAEDAEMLRAYAREARENPKLFGYFVSDEPEVSGIKAKVLEDIYNVFADEDPYHPVIISNDSMHGLHAYAKSADINGLHPYPVTLQTERVNDLSSVAVFTEESVRFFEGQAHRQTIAYLHQGFNYGDYGAVNNRIPTYVEYRDQNLLALACGARGLIQFNRLVAHYPELHIGMPHLTNELASLGPIIASPTSETVPLASSDALKMLLKERDGHLYLLACNADTEPRDVEITIPGIGERGPALRVTSEGREVALDGDKFTDRFDAWEAHVYTTGDDSGLPTVAEIVAEIAEANARRQKPGNLAFQASEGDGVVLTASSSKAAKFRRPDTGLWHVVDGVIDQIDRYSCLTWQDDTADEFPDWLEIALPEPHAIGRVVVYPFEKSLRDYAVQAFADGEWRDVDEVSGQNADQITHEFDAVTTDRIRLMVTAANGSNSLVTEVEIYEK
ncbi:MAG TPA: discoidin domain-containing protein, partial [Armatimonadota bacterium]|nr:discoidin domain-containing protein [Armatimonadota bacterium]